MDHLLLEAFCGVGVVVSLDQIESTVQAIIDIKKDDVLKQR